MRKEKNKTKSQRSQATILVVDDEPEVGETLRGILEYEGFKVEMAENGREALDRLMSGHRFDLIITDMKMPEMDGLELLRRVRQLRENLPVIVLTAYATIRNGLQAMKEGVYDYISKPFSVDLLIRVVREALKDSPLGVRKHDQGSTPVFTGKVQEGAS
jgi:DNA-binding NtrC family response regulator